MLFHYLETVSLIMNSRLGTPLKAKKYILGITERTHDHRPGGIDWDDDDEGDELIVVLHYTSQFNGLPMDKKIEFQTNYLKIPWAPANVDTSFSHLTKKLSKNYTVGGSGVDRFDFN